MSKKEQNIGRRLYQSLLVYAVLGTLTIGAIIAAVSLLPMYERMKSYQQDGLKHAVHTRMIAVRQYISGVSDVAIANSSRTKAREALEAYNQGEIDLEQHNAKVRRLLSEAVERMDEIASLVRLDINHKSVITIGKEVPEEHWIIPDKITRNAVAQGPLRIDGEDYIVVGAPILNPNSERVGTDVVLFSLNSLKTIIHDVVGLGDSGEAILFKIAGRQAVPIFPRLRAHGEAVLDEEQAVLAEKFNQSQDSGSETVILLRDQIGTDYIMVSSPLKELSWLLTIRMAKKELYASVTQQVVLIVTIVITLMVLGAGIMSLLLRPLAGRVMIHTDELERQVEAKTKKIGQILQSIGDAFMSLDRDLHVTYANAHVESMFKVKESDLVGQDIWSKLPGVAECFLKGIQKVSDENIPVRMESYYTSNHVWLAAHIYPLEEGLSIYLHDITRRKTIEEELLKEKEEQKKLIERLKNTQNQLLQSEKMASVGQLAAGIAHEINNPIGFVNSNIGALRNYVFDLLKLIELYESSESQLGGNDLLLRIASTKFDIDFEYLKEDIKSLLDESQDGVLRVKQIVEDLKDFSHVDEAEWQFSDLHKGMDSTLNIVNNEIKYKADVIKEYGEMPDVECMPSQINQVFMNLLVNAAQAIEQSGTITVRTGTIDDDWCWVEVEDTGKGIEEAHLKRIFEPFFTTKPVGTGTGLGLSLTYGIIEKHNGKIEVKSTVGKGTCFKVLLPVRRKSVKGIT